MNRKVEKSKEKIPELRFPGFDGEWEEKRLGEVGRIVTGKTPSTTDKTLWSGDVLFVTPTDIINGEKYQRQTVRKVEVSDQKKILPSGSILYTCIASIGKMSVSTVSSVTNQQINALVTSEKSDNEFVFYALLNETPCIKAIQANTTLPIINKTEFSRIKIEVPSLEEQQKIAVFLTTVDEWIENLKAEKEKWEEYKKGMMQKIFPCGAGQVAEIRFRDEDGNEFPDWEEKRLEEVASLKHGYAFKSANYVDEGQYRVVTISNVQNGRLVTDQTKRISALPKDLRNHQLLSVGDMLVSMTGNVGRICVVDQNDCALNQRVGKIVVDEKNADRVFIFQELNNRRFEYRMRVLAQGGAQGNIANGDILGFVIRLPSLPEQQKIAGFLTAVDEMIHSHQQRIAQVQEWKKGLMQRMFV